jgi:hypothetical protein
MPTESVSFAFSNISFDYKQIDKQGNLQPASSFKYDVMANQKV